MASVLHRPIVDLPKKRHYPPRPPNDWSKSVTVCIAAICDSGKSLIAVCDSKLSLGYTSSDKAALKAHRLNKNWGLLYAGDTSPIVPILLRMREDLRTCSNKLRDVVPLVQKAYKEQHQIKADNLGLSLGKTFLEVELLIFGYDDEAKAHIFIVTDPKGEPAYYDFAGFSTIGSGGLVASAILNFYGHRSTTSLPLGIFHCLAAKFMAESARDVGRDTSLIVFKPDGNIVMWVQPQIEIVRQMWEVDGKPHLPIKVSESISEMYTESEKLMEKTLDKMGRHQWNDQ